MVADSTLLSRIQFGFTIGYHIIFPTITIGLAVFIAIMEGCWLATKKPVYLKLCKFWNRFFALTFGVGVVSGVVLSYELGTNFAPFTNAIGEILGPLFGYEVMTAFFLEAGFLGIMLFGWKRVGPQLHYAATLLVAIGTVVSAFWIMSANSWMQTPAGFKLEAGKFTVVSWVEAIFNPSFLIRFTHMVLGAFMTTLFIIAGISAYYLKQNRHLDVAKIGFSFSLVAALIVTPIQLVVGDMNGLTVFKYQPLKTAAIEGTWHTQKGAPLHLFAIPDSAEAKNKWAVSIPYGASLFNTHSLTGEMPGLTSVSRDQWPVVAPTFFGFRIMVGIGLLYLLIAIYGTWQLVRGRLYVSPYFQTLCILASPLGVIATLSGWITAEMGRQPWVVYGQMRTSEAASKVPFEHVLLSLGLFIVVYTIILGFYLYYAHKLVRKGPAVEIEPPTTIIHWPEETSGETK